LKLFGLPPGIPPEMTTLSLINHMNATFKQTQFLPTLIPDMTVAAGRSQSSCPTCERALPGSRPKASRRTDRRLPLLQDDRSWMEQAMFAVLGACVVFSFAVMTAMLIEESWGWTALQMWIARLLG
jgi:hypothetical protein